MTTAGALAGLRVIDCSGLIAGGVLATVLADHGADVVKVDNPRRAHPPEVLGALGITAAELEVMRREGVI